jgi:AcrR family transcriptional regulator
VATHAAREVRRAQILDAALHCFGEKGLYATKVDDIAAASGLSKGAIYWHFESKEEIFLSLADGISASIDAEWDALECDDPVETLRRFGDSALERLLGARPLLDAWLDFFRHPEARRRMATAYTHSRARLAAVLRRGISHGRLRPCDPVAVATALTGLVEGLLLQALAEPGFDPRPGWRAGAELLLAGMSSSESSRSPD